MSKYNDILRIFTYDLECGHQFTATYYRRGDSLGHRKIGDFCWCLECRVRQMVMKVTPSLIDRSPERVVKLCSRRRNGNGSGSSAAHNGRQHHYPVKRNQPARLPVGACE